VTFDGFSRLKLDELLADLGVERSKLDTLVESLRGLQRSIEPEPPLTLWVDAAALRLQSFYTGIERCFLLIARVINGATPDGADWHRRLLERMAVASPARPAVLRADTVQGLGELLRFRHVVRHLYAYELDADQVKRLLEKAIAFWPEVRGDLDRFMVWLSELCESL
jgi:hypothetical protein